MSENLFLLIFPVSLGRNLFLRIPQNEMVKFWLRFQPDLQYSTVCVDVND